MKTKIEVNDDNTFSTAKIYGDLNHQEMLTFKKPMTTNHPLTKVADLMQSKIDGENITKKQWKSAAAAAAAAAAAYARKKHYKKMADKLIELISYSH